MKRGRAGSPGRVLIYPPFADPTQPYPSLAVLKGHLRSVGLDVLTVDLNVEALHYLLRRETIEDLGTAVGRRFLDLDRRDALDLSEGREYLALAAARPALEALLAADPSPLEVFRRRDLFLDAARYSESRLLVDGLFDALSAARFPLRFGPNRAAHGILPWSFDLLEEYAEGGASPFDDFYGEAFEGDGAGDGPRVPLDGLEFAGISVAFPSQIPEALRIARLLRRRAPEAFIAFGGPCIHQVALSLEPRLLGRLFDFADGVGIFEGEETLARLFPLLGAWRDAPEGGRAAVLRDVPNLLVRDDSGGGAVLHGPGHVVDLAEAPPPDYSDLDLDRYLAPARILLYVPTRGCYWNRCSFCRYGLSERATARYREVPPARAASQLARLSRRHGVRDFYLSCDVLSPAYAVRFAEALIERGLRLRWSTDLKADPYYTAERCAVLHRGGLRAAAFGMESGSDRVLGLIGKGCGRAAMTEVNRSFHDAGIATAWMTFTGHPGETVEEAIETVRWIEEEAARVDLFMVGEFSLETGSAISLDPGRYGVDRIYRAEGDDLGLYPLYTEARGARSAADRERIDREVERLASRWRLRPYPWAGAISTHHSFIHFLEFGPRAFRTHFGPGGDGRLPEPPASGIRGLRDRPRFPLEALAAREERFLEGYLRAALRPPAVEGGQDRAPLCRDHFEAAEAREESIRP
jgi:anaerobic magnesium-protoporphyrin IX monomethyl ester cyclase